MPLSGCWDANDAERMVYAQGLGIDYKNGKYVTYVQLINLSMLAKSESGAGVDKQVSAEIGQASGNSVEDALFNLYKNSQRRIHWGHLNYVFLTTSALRQDGLQAVTDIIDRYYQTHYHMWIYSTEKPLPKVLNTMPPINMSTYLSRVSDPTAAFGQYSYIQSLDMREVVISHYEPPHEIIIPLVSNNMNQWKGDGKPRNVAIITGISVLSRNNKLMGTIKNTDAIGYRWVEKKFKRTGLSFHKNGHGNFGIMIAKRKVKIQPVIKNGRIQFDILIRAKALINKLEKNIPTSYISQAASKEIKKEVLLTYQKGLEIDADVYRFSNVLYKKEFALWKKVQKGGEIPLTEDSIRNVTVDVRVVDGGKQRKIPTLNKH